MVIIAICMRCCILTSGCSRIFLQHNILRYRKVKANSVHMHPVMTNSIIILFVYIVVSPAQKEDNISIKT